MRCKCGAEIKEGARFCNKCGSPVENVQTSNAPKSDVSQAVQKENVVTADNIAKSDKQKSEKDKKLSIITLVLGIIVAILVIAMIVVGVVFAKNYISYSKAKSSVEANDEDDEDDDDEDDDEESLAKDEKEDDEDVEEAEPTATPTPIPTPTPTPEPVRHPELEGLYMSGEIDAILQWVHECNSNTSHYMKKDTGNAVYYYVPDNAGVVIIKAKNASGANNDEYRTYYGTGIYYVKEETGSFVNEYFFSEGYLFACYYNGVWHYYGEDGWDLFDEKGVILAKEREIYIKNF